MGYYATTTHAAGAPYAPLYLYMRKVYGAPPSAGMVPEQALTEAKTNGVDTQADYTQGTTNYTIAPTAAEILNATHYKVTNWTTLWSGSSQGTAAQTLMKQAIASGNPVAIGFPVFRDFEAIRSGALYNTLSGASLGGHMVAVFAYDAEGIWIRNQWGTGWGASGDAHLSWAFVQTLVSGAYTVSGITTTAVTPVVPIVVAPTVTALSVKTGLTTGGGQVTITGTNLASATAVRFGDTPAMFTVAQTQLIATIPAHAAGIVDVTVTNATGKSVVGALSKFTYNVPAPIVITVNPATVTTLGGTVVTLTGTSFTGATAVKVDATPAASVKVLSDTSLTFVAPARTTVGSPHVTVTTARGTSAVGTADQLRYTLPPAPAITGLSVTSGKTNESTPVVLTGTNLPGITKVTAGGVAIAFTRVSDTQLRVVLAAHVAAAVHLQVTGPGGTSLAGNADLYTWTPPPAPIVTRLSVTSAKSTQSTPVTVTGTNLIGTSKVTVGGVAVSFTGVTATQLTLVLPAHVAAALHVQVTGPGGTSIAGSTDLFTWTAPPVPVVTKLSATSGTAGVSTVLIVTGTGFTGATRALVGPYTAAVIVISDSSLRLTVPAVGAGVLPIRVVTLGGTSATVAEATFTLIRR
jgi:hypothetical protein